MAACDGYPGVARPPPPRRGIRAPSWRRAFIEGHGSGLMNAEWGALLLLALANVTDRAIKHRQVRVHAGASDPSEHAFPNATAVCSSCQSSLRHSWKPDIKASSRHASQHRNLLINLEWKESVWKLAQLSDLPPSRVLKTGLFFGPTWPLWVAGNTCLLLLFMLMAGEGTSGFCAYLKKHTYIIHDARWAALTCSSSLSANYNFLFRWRL